jgi:hypothetical protein
MQQFLKFDNSFTDEGRALIAYIEGEFMEADKVNNLEILNNLSGMIGHYYVNVFKAKAMTPEQWVRDYPNAANAAWGAKQYRESQQQQAETVAETATQTSSLAAELTAFKEAVQKELDALKAENAALKTQVESGNKKKPAKSEDTPETEA